MNISCLYGISPNAPDFRILLACLYFIMTITATTLNGLVLVAIWKTSALHKPSYILLGALAAADLMNGAFIAPSMAVSHIAKVKNWKNFYCELLFITRGLGYWTSSVSLFTLTFISVDRLLAVALRNRYQTVVTLKRVSVAALFSWVTPWAIVLPVTVDFSGSKFDVLMIVTGVILILLLGTIVASYSMAYRFLKKLTNSVSPTNGTSEESVEVSSNLTTAKYRKTLNTMVIICVILLLFFIPFLVCSLQMSGMSLSKGEEYETQEDVRRYLFWIASECLVFSNSAVNPLLYLWRMKDLREAIVVIVRKMPCIRRNV